MADYLIATNRSDIASLANSFQHNLRSDPDYKYIDFFFELIYSYDRVIEIDLSTLQPMINGPFTPDLGHTISDISTKAKQQGWPLDISVCFSYA